MPRGVDNTIMASPDLLKPEGQLRIGLVGAGLVGSTALLALSRLPNVQVKAFEKSPVPREAGAWISLTVTGQKVLTRLIPPAEINRIVYRPPDRAVYVTRHGRTGQVLLRRYSSDSLKEDYIQARTHRAPLLQLILDHVPEGAIQYDRRVAKVEISGEEAELHFEDGQEPERFDLIVAADGIYSPTRKSFWPDHIVGYKGSVAYRTIFPVSQIAHVEGLHDDSSAWRKDGDVVFLSELGLGMYGVTIIRRETAELAASLQWERSIGVDGLNRLRDVYKSWDPVIGRVLDAIDDIDAYPLDSGPWLPQLSQAGRVAFVGDAAHPTAGAYGAGAAMGFGDCWALYRALEASQAPGGKYDVLRALRIFGSARLPYLARVEQQMRLDIGHAKYIAEAGGDEAEWSRRVIERSSDSQWLVEHDVELAVQSAITAEPYNFGDV